MERAIPRTANILCDVWRLVRSTKNGAEIFIAAAGIILYIYIYMEKLKKESCDLCRVELSTRSTSSSNELLYSS